MKSLTLNGSFYEMGRQYGVQGKKEIRTFSKMSYLMASLAQKPGSQPFNPNLWRFIPTLLTYRQDKVKWQHLSREYEKEILAYHPDAIDFMKGIADGTGLAYIDVLNLNVATEHMITCSTWAAVGDSTLHGEPLVGMNSDEEPMTGKYEYFLHINPDHGFRYKVTSIAGWAGYNHGMNEKGLTVTGTLLWTLPEKKKKIRPPMMVLMRVLNTCSTVAEAKAFIESVPNHELGTVFYIADSRSFMRVECTYEKRVYRLVENGSLCNANLLTSPELQYLDGSGMLKQTLNATIRTRRLNKLLQEYEGRIDPEVMHTIASDHGEEGDGSRDKSICQHPKGLRYNYKTLITFVAEPQKKQFRIYEGNPCERKSTCYNFME